MHTTIREIAKKAGVSTATISRVLNNASSNVAISEETRKKVLSICEELKYQPNIHSQRFFTKKSKMVGLIVPPQAKLKGVLHTFTDYNLGDLLSGVEQAVTERNYRLTLLVADDDFINKKNHVRLIRDQSLDGLLLWGLQVDETYILDLQRESFPYLLLNGCIEGRNVNSVVADNEGASFAITTHLIRQNHRRIAYIKGIENCSVSIDRYKGYERAMKAEGLAIPDELIDTGDFMEESGYLATKRLLSGNVFPTAIMAVNDMMAIGAMKAIKEKGLKIPQNIALTGGDGIPLTEYVEPALTTFKVPMYEIGIRGVSRLFEMIEGKRSEPTLDVLETKLLIRTSSERTVIL